MMAINSSILLGQPRYWSEGLLDSVLTNCRSVIHDAYPWIQVEFLWPILKGRETERVKVSQSSTSNDCLRRKLQRLMSK
jgi:hypothetical protein